MNRLNIPHDRIINMDTKVTIDKEAKKQLISNFLINRKSKSNCKFTRLVCSIIYPNIDIDGFPVDVINIIKAYYDDEDHFSYYLYQDLSAFHPPYGVIAEIHIYRQLLFKMYNFDVKISVQKVYNHFVIKYYSNIIDNRILNIIRIYPTDAEYIPNLCSVINYYMHKKYNIDQFIPHIINNEPKIIHIGHNLYQCITSINNIFFIHNVQLINEHLFEIIALIINELIACLVEYLNEKN